MKFGICHLDAQESGIAADLASRSHCGLTPANVLLVAQQARAGYVFDVQQRQFVSTRDAARRSMRRRSSMGGVLVRSGTLRLSGTLRRSGTLRQSGTLRRSGTLSSSYGKSGLISAGEIPESTASATRAQGGVGFQLQSSRPRQAAVPALGGTGYCMMQLGWEGEAQVVGEDGNCAPVPGTALDYLTSRGARWA